MRYKYYWQVEDSDTGENEERMLQLELLYVYGTSVEKENSDLRKK